MTHALIPEFSVPLALPPLRLDDERVPFHADPVLAAIERHSEAWSVFQVAPDGEPSERANDEMDAALTALLGTACVTRAGAFCLLRHLRWWLDEEEPNAAAYGDEWAVAQAREADLTLLLGCDGIRRIPVALPSGRLIGQVLARPAPITIEAGPAPAPALVRLSRVAGSVGELLACLVLVAGGCGLVGLATLF